MKLKRSVRYVEVEGLTALHLADAVSSGLVRDTSGTAIRFVEHDGEIYVCQQDLIDNRLLRDFIGVETTGETNGT